MQEEGEVGQGREKEEEEGGWRGEYWQGGRRIALLYGTTLVQKRVVVESDQGIVMMKVSGTRLSLVAGT